MRVRARLLGLLAVAVGGLTLAPTAQAAGAPVVTDTWAAAVSATGVDLHAKVNPGEAETAVKFEYIADFAYRANLEATPPRDPFTGAVGLPAVAASIGSGNTPVEFSRHLGGLKPASVYHFRIVAASGEGPALGPARIFTTQQTGPVSTLLDERGWEMVSPVDKNGGEIQGPGGIFGGGVFQASADGGSFTYGSTFSFGAGQGAPGASQYISRRGGNGWATENVTTPTTAGAYGTSPDGVPYQLFSDDLARGLVFDPPGCETAPCPRRYELRQSSNGALTASATEADLAFAGTSPDLSSTVLSTCAALTPNAIEVAGVGGACDPGKANLYEWSGAGLTLINLLPGDTQGTPGAALGARAGAVSSDGTRAYFTVAGNLYLYEGSQTVRVDEAAAGGGVFQSATPDGTIAFFTKAEHLYRYTTSTGLAVDLTPGGGVEGVLGASADGSYLYYLTASGLFLEHGGIATKAAATADAGNYPPATGTARISANGNLAFLARATLTEADTGGFAEVYLYSPAAASLVCASCNPSGSRPLGPSSIPGAVANGKLSTATQAYKPRALSAAGNRIFFDSADALASTDTNSDQDVYEWEAQGTGSCLKPGGCLALISSGRAEGGATFLDASADGSDAFFVTDGSLVGTDPAAADVYDARVGGGFPVPAVPIACIADACQVVPGEPEDPAVGTAFFRAEANPPVKFPKAKKHRKKHHRKKHHGKGGRS